MSAGLTVLYLCCFFMDLKVSALRVGGSGPITLKFT